MIQHPRDLFRLDQERSLIRLGPGEVQWVRHEAVRLGSAPIETELAYNKLACASRVGGQRLQPLTPVIEDRWSEIDCTLPDDKFANTPQYVFFMPVATSEGPLMPKKRVYSHIESRV
jgi:hypothetical protein